MHWIEVSLELQKTNSSDASPGSSKSSAQAEISSKSINIAPEDAMLRHEQSLISLVSSDLTPSSSPQQ